MKAKINKKLLDSIVPKTTPFEINDEELKGFILRVQPSGVMIYYTRYRLDNGRQNRIKLGTADKLTPVQARDMAKAALAKVVQGEDPSADKKQRKAHTLGSFVDGDYGPWLKSNTKSGKEDLVRLKLNFKHLLEKSLHEINAWQIEKWRAARLNGGTKPRTANRDLATLRAALSKAVEWGMLDEHPLKKIKPCKIDNNGVVRYLEADEEDRLLAALDEREERIRTDRDSGNAWREDRGHGTMPNLREVAFADYLKPMVLISMNTGLRRGELFHLTWKDVNLEKKLLTVQGDGAKSGRTRHIPLNNTALLALKGWKEQNSGGALVFSNNMKSFTHVKRSWGNVLDAAKIESFRWHDLRHHFASKLVMRGVDLYTIKDLLGHSTITMTERYAHLAPEHKAAAVAVLDEPSNVLPFQHKDQQTST